jgi:hypothetical protein
MRYDDEFQLMMRDRLRQDIHIVIGFGIGVFLGWVLWHS